jgi:hypothetical protein
MSSKSKVIINKLGNNKNIDFLIDKEIIEKYNEDEIVEIHELLDAYDKYVSDSIIIKDAAKILLAILNNKP